MVKQQKRSPARGVGRSMIDLEVNGLPRRDNLEDHENSVFKAAVHFRLQRYLVNGRQDRMQVERFPIALQIAREEIAKGNRVLIYAVTQLGQFIVLVPKRWDEYLKLWEAEHG